MNGHMKKLVDAEVHVEKFLVNAQGLRDKVPVVLFQLPEIFRFNAERLETLLRYMAKQKIVPELRTALEVRHDSWYAKESLALLRKHNTALVLADWRGVHTPPHLTADFLFLRRHGSHRGEQGGYTDKEIRNDATAIRGWLNERFDVFMYYNNDAFGHAIRNALRLKELSRS